MLLSVLLAVFSAYIAFLVSGRISSLENRKNSLPWLLAGAFALGGGVWAMHFIGMLAYKLPIAVNYDIFITIISVIPAIFSSFIVLRTSNKQYITIRSIFWRSLLMGGGIGLMHYTGMSAMHMNGIMRYDPALFILSLVFAFILAGISLWFKLQADKHVTPGIIFSPQLIIPSLVMGCAISGMHYTGMAAMTTFPDPTLHIQIISWSTDILVRIISGVILLLGVILIIAIEVSHRLGLYHRIAKSESKVRLLLDSTAEAIYGVDIDAKCTFVNQACIDMLGYKHDSELLGKNMHKLIHYNHPDGVPYPIEDCHIIKAIQQEREIQIDNEVLWRKDGSSFACKYWSHPIFENNKCTGAVVTFLDITDQNIIEETLRRTQKMDALGKLTGGIAHDFNNLLSIVLGYADLLENELREQPELASYAKEIYSAGKRGTKLTQNLLSFSRKKSSDTEAVNINTLLQSERNMLEKTLTARIELTLDLKENLWLIWIDSGDLENAILNLSINAMHALDGSGRLNIKTQNANVNKNDAKLLNLVPGDYVLLSIIDTGIGMDNMLKEKIFEPFFTTKGDKGTGLGLSQVYGFINRCNGTIELKSELDKGSTFTLYFPKYDGHEDKTKCEIKELMPIKGIETILIVDDEPALVTVASQILNTHGYHTISANSAKQALEILEQKSIDLLFTDIIMPEIDGYQLASIVKKKYPSVKIQLVSGYTGDKNEKIVDEELQQNLLYKPYHSENLLTTVRKLLDT